MVIEHRRKFPPQNLTAKTAGTVPLGLSVMEQIVFCAEHNLKTMCSIKSAFFSRPVNVFQPMEHMEHMEHAFFVSYSIFLQERVSQPLQFFKRGEKINVIQEYKYSVFYVSIHYL